MAVALLGVASGAALREVTESNPTAAWPPGAMVSTLGDLRTWAEPLATGRLLKPATLAVFS
jgi:hypothetical protein